MTTEAVSLNEYYAVHGSRFNERDAKIIGPALEALRRDLRRDPTSQEIVTEASSKKSPLHEFFEWDNKRCGEYYRRLQAKDMVNSIKCRVTSVANAVHEVRAFHYVRADHVDPKDDRRDRRGNPIKVVVPLARIMADKQLRLNVKRRVQAEFVAVKRRNAVYMAILTEEPWRDLFAAVDRIEQLDLDLEAEQPSGESEEES